LLSLILYVVAKIFERHIVNLLIGELALLVLSLSVTLLLVDSCHGAGLTNVLELLIRELVIFVLLLLARLLRTSLEVLIA
jgi:hypothetical protein